MIDDSILNHHRPGQYIGNEWNVSRKDFSSCALSFALGFPDLYEVGMSNLGLRIIYGVLNKMPDVTCERFFAPEADFAQTLKNSHKLLFSLESQKELIGFDFLGFSLGSELNYTNVLSMLELAGIPLESSQRDNRYPLVIAGGPCTLNPEPMADFFDLFVIGEAEDAILEVLENYKKFKQGFKEGRINKEELLIQLSQIEGVYAPSLYEVNYSKDELASFAPKNKNVPAVIKKRFVSDLDASFFPEKWLVPNVQAVHDRATVEVMRGCPNRCRFCQARSQYFPLRLRSKEKVCSLVDLAYCSSGYEEISLAGLSVSDYPGLEGLVKDLTNTFKENGINLSLPSLKAKSLLGNVSTMISKIKKTGLTFAPEAGSEKLRQAIAKDFSEEEFFKAAGCAYTNGYQHLKLYFLIGLAGETEEDLKSIIEFSARVSNLKKEILAGSAAQINISINPLIPKPHTSLQWLKMESIASLEEKRDYIRKNCKNKKLKINFHNFDMAFLEGVLSRGDRRLGKVIKCAYKKGARFDAWSDYFSFPAWQEAFLEEGLNPQVYLSEKPVNALLPWDFIDTGIDKKTLISEFNTFSGFF